LNCPTPIGGSVQPPAENEVERTVSSKPLHILLVVIPRLCSFLFIVILFLWIFQAEGGLGFDESSVFGWHALLMGVFTVLCTQEAILSFSAPIFAPLRTSRSFISKGFHIFCHTLGIVCAMLGIVAIVYYKNLSPQPVAFPFYATYSPHSWLGISVLCLWAIQMIFGIVTTLEIVPKLLWKLHKFLGKVIYCALLATCALGFQNMQSSDLASSTQLIPGIQDTLSMNSQGSINIGNVTVNVTGYFPYSPESEYACACTLLLFFMGIATFGVLEFLS